jgi:hypothetical protein
MALVSASTRVGLASMLLLLTLTPPALAGGADVARCADAFERAQALRLDRKFSAARAGMIECSRARCPASLRRECIKAVEQIDEDMGSIVVRGLDDQGNDVPIDELSIDGAPVPARRDGWAIAVDPGPHVLRAVAVRHPPAEQSIVVNQGEKNRAVVVPFDSSAAASTAPPLAVTPSRPSTPSDATRRGRPIAAYVASGVAVAAFTTVGIAAISGFRELDDLHAECPVRRSCSEVDVDGVKTRLFVADVAAAVGVVAVGIAVYLFIDHGRSRTAHTAVRRPGVLAF